MNNKQKNIIFITVGIMTLMLLFPPYVVLNYKQVIIDAGYGFITSLPPYLYASGGSAPATVNISTLLTQVSILIFSCVLLCFALKDNAKQEN